MTKKENPFTLSFGKKPYQYITRLYQTDTIISEFSAEQSPTQIYMITGVRGSGKTVMMSNIANHFAEHKDWIVIELSPEKNIMTALASRLYNSSLNKHFIEAQLDLSFFGIGLSVKKAGKITDIDVAVEKMLEVIKKKNKRLLITIDEATDNEYIREFASMFQIYIRQDYPMYLLMTGLYENIYDLQNEKTLTFLYRAPKMLLEPLNTGAVINSYRTVFDITFEKASEMYAYTKGYPFAFQVLGYLCFENGGAKALKDILPLYDQYLDEYVYSKIWSELSETDRSIMRYISEIGETGVTQIRNALGMDTSKFSVYRKRLINKGILSGKTYGVLEITLPRFDLFVRTQL